MTRSFKVVSEAQARIEAIKASGDGVLIGYEDKGDAIVVGAASSAASEAEITALLPAPLRILGPLSAAAGAAASPLSTNPLQQSHTLVRCSVPLTLEVPSSSSLAEELSRWEATLTGAGASFVVNSADLAGNQPLPTGSWDAPVTMTPVARAPTALAAPSGSVTPGVETVRWASISLDVLAYVPSGTTSGEAASKYVAPALAAQLQACRREAATAKGSALPTLRAFHFLPPGLGHHITVVYPLPPGTAAEAAEAALAGRRRALHAALGLPADRPLLRAANAVDPGNNNADSAGGKSQQAQQIRLKNVHEGLPPSGIKGGSVHLVGGDYDYFHYMQDRFDDSGWGCAYRSLQTLCSWFQRQHYTARAPPGHREIQATLVSLGDKPADFLGSKQWIGAIELGFVLDSLLGVSCKVITVASGDEMPSHAREIAAHFDTQGTPIMIGGGVLAYTLLGVHYNAETGEAAFLILDPHYTGVDELGKIRAGQWVAWKRLGDKAAAGGELFVPGAFYNLLCPQRPNAV